MAGPRFYRGFVTANMTGTPATRSQEEKDLQSQWLKFQETQVEASEKALTRASKAYADIVNSLFHSSSSLYYGGTIHRQDTPANIEKVEVLQVETGSKKTFH